MRLHSQWIPAVQSDYLGIDISGRGFIHEVSLLLMQPKKARPHDKGEGDIDY